MFLTDARGAIGFVLAATLSLMTLAWFITTLNDIRRNTARTADLPEQRAEDPGGP